MNRLKALTSMVFRRYSVRSWFLPASVRRYQGLVGDGTDSSVVMAPLLWLARNFPEAPPAIWEQVDGEEEMRLEHPIIRLLRRPNPYYSGSVLWMATLIDWNVTGDGYWLKVRNGTGTVRELWFTPSSLLESVGTDKEFITHYVYRPGDGREVKLDPEDVVHFRYGLDPEDPRKGLSPLKSVLREIFTDDEAAAFSASLLKNMGVPGLLVSPEGEHTPGPDDVKATKDYVHDEFSGEGRGKPLVMSGPTKVQQFGFNPAQMDLKNLRRVPEERVSAVTGIPAIVAGLGAGLDRSTFANFAEARTAAFEDGVIPAQRILGEELTFQLLTDFEDDPWRFRVGFDLSNVRVLQEDQNRLAERVNTLVGGGVMQLGEGRRKMGLETTPADDIYLRPFALLEVPAGQPGNTNDPDEDPPEPKRRFKTGSRSQQRLVLAFDRERKQLEAVLAEEMETDFAALGTEAERAFREVVPAEALEEGKALRNGNRKASDESIAANVAAAMNLSEWQEEKLKNRLEVHYKRTADATVETLNTVMDLGVDLPDEVARKIVSTGGTRRGLVDIDKSTREAITRALADGREAGDGPAAIARRIRDEVPAGRFTNAGPAYRAQLIARTETLHAQRVSSIEAYKAADTVTAVLAFDARLGDSDPDCEARDGQTFTFEQAELEMAQEHPNGTLSFAPVVGTPELQGAA